MDARVCVHPVCVITSVGTFMCVHRYDCMKPCFVFARRTFAHVTLPACARVCHA